MGVKERFELTIERSIDACDCVLLSVHPFSVAIGILVCVFADVSQRFSAAAVGKPRFPQQRGRHFPLAVPAHK